MLLGAVFVIVWGAELSFSLLGALDIADDSLLSSRAIQDYEAYAAVWLVIRAIISSAGVVAGVLIFRERRLGYWLGAASALVLLAFAVDYGWYASLATGKLPPKFFLVTAPWLGYGVIVFPLLVALSLVLSLIKLVRGRHSERLPGSAI